MRWGAIIAVVSFALAGRGRAGEAVEPMKPGDVHLTIYSSMAGWESLAPRQPGQEGSKDLAHVRECRAITLPEGVSEYRFADVSERIDAPTVRFSDLTDPQGTRVLEQNFYYDLVSEATLLKHFLERPVEFVDGRGERHSGKLLSSGESLILRTRRDAIEVIGYGKGEPYTIRLSELPKDLLTRPTLIWKIAAKKAGEHNVVVAYLTEGIRWRADYSAIIGADDARVDLSGWVTLSNTSGAKYPNARVKLFAGHIRRVGEDEREAEEARRRGSYEGVPEPEPEVPGGAKSFFEYRLFALQRPTTIENNQTKQIGLIVANNVPVKKVYTYDGVLAHWWWEEEYHRRDETYGTRCRKTVRVNLEFENTKAANLGMPLPAGIVRAYKRDDADGSLEFVGEDKIAHTPSGERTRIYVGDAFDLVGNRERTSFERPQERQVRESFEISLRNHKDAAVTIYVLEHLYRWLNWKIEASSIPYRKVDSRTIEFAVPVPARGEAKVSYTVFYWVPR